MCSQLWRADAARDADQLADWAAGGCGFRPNALRQERPEGQLCTHSCGGQPQLGIQIRYEEAAQVLAIRIESKTAPRRTHAGQQTDRVTDWRA